MHQCLYLFFFMNGFVSMQCFSSNATSACLVASTWFWYACKYLRQDFFCVILHFLCVASCFFCVFSFRRALFLCVFLSASPTFCDFLFRMFFIFVIVTDLSVRYIASTGFFFFLVREFLSKICLFDFLV